MGYKTEISWTDSTWNPVRGCSRVSPECLNCYAEKVAARFSDADQPFHLFAERTPKPHWTGKVELVEKSLDIPLHWKKPRRIFVNSMSDLFHEVLSDEAIDRVFAVMALCPQHTFQILTKRPERMSAYLSRLSGLRIGPWKTEEERAKWIVFEDFTDKTRFLYGCQWPLPNVWLGVSVGNQETADERIPFLLNTPAAKRFVSYEPALGPVDFEYPESMYPGGPKMCCDGRECGCMGKPCDPPLIYGIDQIIVGGESGPGARPFDIAWARNTIRQCKNNAVACFVKQLGHKPYDSEAVKQGDNYWPVSEERYDAVRAFHGAEKEYALAHVLIDRKGSDMAEWPEYLSVRQFPTG